jgi:cell division protein FtsL
MNTIAGYQSVAIAWADSETEGLSRKLLVSGAVFLFVSLAARITISNHLTDLAYGMQRANETERSLLDERQALQLEETQLSSVSHLQKVAEAELGLVRPAANDASIKIISSAR